MARANLFAGAMALGLVLLVAAAWYGWLRPEPAPAPAAPIATAQPLTSAPPAAPASAAAEAAVFPEPQPEHGTIVLAAADVRQALGVLLGPQAVRTWLRLDDFPRRLVATIDNLGRAHAASLLWPFDPAPGHFKVIELGGRTVIDPDNQQRYIPWLQWVETLDSSAAAALYAQMLPLLQTVYEQLGYPGRRFHTRLLQVIDHLLAAPPAPELIEVRLTEVRGPIPSLRPWVRYEFADPALESASAGHKLMIRIGASNQRRLQAKLRELRAALVQRAAP